MLDVTTEAIWANVKANAKRLDECRGPHDFTDASPEKPLNKNWICVDCGGTVNTVAKNWYLRGLAHGRATK